MYSVGRPGAKVKLLHAMGRLAGSGGAVMTARCYQSEKGPRVQFASTRRTVVCILCGAAALLLMTATAAGRSGSGDLQEAPSVPQCEAVGQDVSHGDALLKVCRYAASLPQRMPNFTCEQKTSRFVNGQAADVITAKVTYADGRESYQDVRTNGHSVDDAALLKLGTWSTGQFESHIRAIFVSGNQTIWQFAGDDKVNGRPALIFQYEVAHQDVASWQLHMEGLSVAPPYRGELWVDEETAAPVRLNVAAMELPMSFPMRSAEVQISYGDVQFGDGTSFVLPVRSVVDSSATAGRQSRNVLQFQNCHKFRGTARMVPLLK